MGVFLNLNIIPQRIPQEKWEPVYEEALKIVNGCGFLDRIYTERNGQKHFFGRKSTERDLSGRGLGVFICGTLESGFEMEDFLLYRNISYYRDWDKGEVDNGVDILFSSYYTDKKGSPQPNCEHNIWGGKTQGTLGHIPLLGIACLFADRLPDAVTVSGDISAGQCRTAVDFVNQFLDRPIDTPVICHPTPLAERIKKADIPDDLKLDAFFHLYQGSLTPEVGKSLQSAFSKDEIYEYFRAKLHNTDPEKYYFSDRVRDYLLLDFDFADLMKMLVSDPSGNQLSLEKALSILLSYNIHVPFDKKNTSDPGDFSNATQGENTAPTGIEALFGRMFFRMSAGKNKNLPVYVSLETIKGVCRGLGEDTEALIDRLLSEQTESEVQKKVYGTDEDSVMNIIEKTAEVLQAEDEEKQDYDISDFKDIFCYKAGYSIEPNLEKGLIRAMQQVQTFNLEDEFKSFLMLGKEERENTFIRQNRYILIWENTWEHIWGRVMDDDYIRRYFYLFRVDCSKKSISDMMEPLFSKPELIDYLWEKAETAPTEETAS